MTKAGNTYTTLKVTSAQLGDHLGGLRDLTQQLSDLLTNPAPGGIVAKRDELMGMIEQAQQLVSESTAQLETLNGLTSLLTQHLSTLIGALGTAGVTKITFSGPAQTVAGEHAQALAQAATGAQLHGFTLVATNPSAKDALSGLIGVAESLGQ